MKNRCRLCVLLLTMLFLTACSNAQDIYGSPDNVKVDSVMQPYFDEFVELMAENNISINWDKIQTIEAIPLRRGINGLYSTETKNIYINWDYALPRFLTNELTPEQQQRMVKEAVFCILAHEIAHSQGYKHVPQGLDLMSKSDAWLYWAIVNLGHHEYTLMTFCNGQ